MMPQVLTGFLLLLREPSTGDIAFFDSMDRTNKNIYQVIQCDLLILQLEVTENLS